MYSKQETSLIRKKFWEKAGQYFAPMPSAGLEKVNWINYKTGVRFIAFRLHVDDKIASVAIEISHPDSDKRKSFYNTFLSLISSLEGDWTWEEETGSMTCRISRSVSEVNIYEPQTWPIIISFFKTAIIQLDSFWVEYREVFEMID